MSKSNGSKVIYNVILILAIIGLGFASYQTIEHYFLTSSVCDFTSNFSCSAVTESQYGELPFNSGIALSLYGVLWWLGLLALAYKGKKSNWSLHKDLYVLLWNGFGFLFAIYLVLIELVILPKETGTVIICPFCTVQHVIILTSFVLSFFLLRKPLSDSLKGMLFVKKKFNPKIAFFLITLLIITAGWYFFLGSGQKEVQYYEFTACLAGKGITMYGFDACPNCNKQKHLLGLDAFEKSIDGTGRYVRCRPNQEAQKVIGDRLAKISILSKYKDQVTAQTTQGQLCTMMVGRGTPTWIFEDKQESGWMTIPELADFSGCPIPKNYQQKESTTGQRVTLKK